MIGIITFYINFHPELEQDVQQTIDMFRLCNKELFDEIKESTQYRIAIVPTTKEACRIEKIDFDKPFPRFSPRNNMDSNRSLQSKEVSKQKEGKSE